MRAERLQEQTIKPDDQAKPGEVAGFLKRRLCTSNGRRVASVEAVEPDSARKTRRVGLMPPPEAKI